MNKSSGWVMVFLFLALALFDATRSTGGATTVKAAALSVAPVASLTIHDALGHTRVTTATFNGLTFGYNTSGVLIVTMDISTSKIYCGDFE